MKLSTDIKWLAFVNHQVLVAISETRHRQRSVANVMWYLDLTVSMHSQQKSH